MNWITLCKSNNEYDLIYQKLLEKNKKKNSKDFSYKNIPIINECISNGDLQKINFDEEKIDNFLTNAKLTEFSTKLKESGYIEMGDLIDIDKQQLNDIGFKTVHIKYI